MFCSFGSRSQCINQMKELKEQCEERIEEIAKKGSEIPQYKEEKDKNDHVRISFCFTLSVAKPGPDDLTCQFKTEYGIHT